MIGTKIEDKENENEKEKDHSPSASRRDQYFLPAPLPCYEVLETTERDKEVAGWVAGEQTFQASCACMDRIDSDHPNRDI
jgi:hypothetical protein